MQVLGLLLVLVLVTTISGANDMYTPGDMVTEPEPEPENVAMIRKAQAAVRAGDLEAAKQCYVSRWCGVERRDD